MKCATSMNYGLLVGTMLVFLLASCFLTCYSHEVCIVPESGSRKPPSYCESATTINDFCQHGSDTDSDISHTVATVLNGTHMLNRTCELHHVNNLTLRGQSESKPVIQCSASSFIFQNASMLRISGIEFTGCGTNLIKNFQLVAVPNNTLSALLFVNGSDLAVTNVTVSDSKSVGIHIKNVVGSVNVDSCILTNASASFNSIDILSGNILEYHPSVSKDVNLTIVDTLIMKNYMSPTHYDLKTCTFSSGVSSKLKSNH